MMDNVDSRHDMGWNTLHVPEPYPMKEWTFRELERNGTLWSTTGRQNVERDGVERNSPATVVAEGVAPSTDPQGPVGLLPRPFACVTGGGVGPPPLNFFFPDYYCRQAA